MKYFSQQALDNLKYYKYSAEDRSYLVKWFLGAFWNWVISLFPLWVAPNLITGMGFSLILINFGCLLIYAPTLQEECPSWVYLSWVFGIFIYQILDNIDGKQARRTGSSSALGEIFDHGCDSLFATLSTITLCASFRFTPWIAHAFMLSVMLPFYFSHWEEWHTGKLILSAYGNPTEAQLGMCTVHLITFFNGPQWWEQTYLSAAHRWFPFASPIWNQMAFMDAEIKIFVAALFALLACFAILENTLIVLNNIAKEHKKLIDSLLLLVPIITNIGFSSIWFYISPAKLMENYTIASIVFTGLLSSYTLDRMLFNRITKTEFSVFKFVFLLPIIGLSFSIYNNAFNNADALADFYCFEAMLALLILAYAHMLYFAINELCVHLKIRCFKIPYPPPSLKQS